MTREETFGEMLSGLKQLLWMDPNKAISPAPWAEPKTTRKAAHEMVDEIFDFLQRDRDAEYSYLQSQR